MGRPPSPARVAGASGRGGSAATPGKGAAVVAADGEYAPTAHLFFSTTGKVEFTGRGKDLEEARYPSRLALPARSPARPPARCHPDHPSSPFHPLFKSFPTTTAASWAAAIADARGQARWLGSRL